MKFVLPYPPSANRYWRVWRGRAVKSTEARAYGVQVASSLFMGRQLSQFKFKVTGKCSSELVPESGPVIVTVDLFRPAKRGDLDNCLKVLLDSLKGIAFVDDKQVVEIHARRFEDKNNPRAEVSVEAAK